MTSSKPQQKLFPDQPSKIQKSSSSHSIHSHSSSSSTKSLKKPKPKKPKRASHRLPSKKTRHRNIQQQLTSQLSQIILKNTKSLITSANLDTKSYLADIIHRSIKSHYLHELQLQNIEREETLQQNKQKKKKKLHSSSISSNPSKMRLILQYIHQLTEIENRSKSLSTLSKMREDSPGLAPLLWRTPSIIAALIQEVISVYPYINSAISKQTISSKIAIAAGTNNYLIFSTSASNRCCNALALLQCVASHPETRGLFLRAHIPIFLYPFLQLIHGKNDDCKPFEYLCLTSLGVIGALVKHPHPNKSNGRCIPDSHVTKFLVETQAIPLCLNIMRDGNELSKTVATFIIQKILLDDYGLKYFCETPERFYAISNVLTKMIANGKSESVGVTSANTNKLIKHAIRCYLRLCDDKKVLNVIHRTLPEELLNSSKLEKLVADDADCVLWLKQLKTKYLYSHKKRQEQEKRKADGEEKRGSSSVVSSGVTSTGGHRHGSGNSGPSPTSSKTPHNIQRTTASGVPVPMISIPISKYEYNNDQHHHQPSQQHSHYNNPYSSSTTANTNTYHQQAYNPSGNQPSGNHRNTSGNLMSRHHSYGPSSNPMIHPQNTSYVQPQQQTYNTTYTGYTTGTSNVSSSAATSAYMNTANNMLMNNGMSANPMNMNMGMGQNMNMNMHMTGNGMNMNLMNMNQMGGNITGPPMGSAGLQHMQNMNVNMQQMNMSGGGMTANAMSNINHMMGHSNDMHYQ